MNMVHESNEDKIMSWLLRYPSNMLLMHHRFPTSTINVKRAAHPFSTKDFFGKNQYILVHNGVIYNAEELYQQHTQAGIRYHSELQDGSFNDSEALLWDFALYMEGYQDELKAKGSIAFICLQTVKGKLKKMHFGRNTNPLYMHRTKEGLRLASEGQGENIEPEVLHTWHYGSSRLTKKALLIPSRVYTTQYQPQFDWHQWENRTITTEVSEFDIGIKKRQYLRAAGDDYEVAYWNAETDYVTLECKKERTTNEEREMRVLEKVLSRIYCDPKYIDQGDASWIGA